MTKYTPVYDKEHLKKLPCQHCGKLVKTHVDPNFKRDPKVYCHEHRHFPKHPEPLNTKDANAPITKIIKDVMQSSATGPVKIFKPGDEGFDERVGQLRQPKKQPKQYYWRTFGRPWE